MHLFNRPSGILIYTIVTSIVHVVLCLYIFVMSSLKKDYFVPWGIVREYVIFLRLGVMMTVIACRDRSSRVYLGYRAWNNWTRSVFLSYWDKSTGTTGVSQREFPGRGDRPYFWNNQYIVLVPTMECNRKTIASRPRKSSVCHPGGMYQSVEAHFPSPRLIIWDKTLVVKLANIEAKRNMFDNPRRFTHLHTSDILFLPLYCKDKKAQNRWCDNWVLSDNYLSWKQFHHCNRSPKWWQSGPTKPKQTTNALGKAYRKQHLNSRWFRFIIPSCLKFPAKLSSAAFQCSHLVMISRGSGLASQTRLRRSLKRWRQVSALWIGSRHLHQLEGGWWIDSRPPHLLPNLSLCPRMSSCGTTGDFPCFTYYLEAYKLSIWLLELDLEIDLDCMDTGKEHTVWCILDM